MFAKGVALPTGPLTCLLIADRRGGKFPLLVEIRLLTA